MVVKTSTFLCRLLKHIQKDHGTTSVIRSDELFQQYERFLIYTGVNNSLNTRTFGRVLKRVFPDVVVKTAKSKLNPGKTVQLYQGVAWKPIHSEQSQVNLVQLAENLPDGILTTTKPSNTAFSFAINSGNTSNGNVVLKVINIIKDDDIDTSYRWNLSVRGTTINLEEHGLSSRFEPTVDFMNSILDTVKKLSVCSGVPREKLDNEIKKCYSEYVTLPGDENGAYRLRSHLCKEVLGLLSAGSQACRRCQIDLRRNSSPAAEDDVSKSKQPKLESSVNEEGEYDDTYIELNEEDDAYLNSLITKLLPDAGEDMKAFFRDQHQALKARCPAQRRWSTQVISLCLNMFIRSPKMYSDLKDSNMLILPSGRHLCRFKNYIPQESGLQREILSWMYHAAKDAQLPPHGWAGGLIHDETKVQSDLVLTMKGGNPTLVGWVDTGSEGQNMRTLKAGKVKQKLATEAFQLVWLGYTGFRFPILHCPTAGISASELSIFIHNAIKDLADWGFQVDFVLQDGGEENRQFMKAHFEGSKSTYLCSFPNCAFFQNCKRLLGILHMMLIRKQITCCFTPPGNPDAERYQCPHTFDTSRTIKMCQDFSHNIKKLRNAIYSSGTNKGQHTRYIVVSVIICVTVVI